MDDIETTLLDKSGTYQVDREDMSFACPSGITHDTIKPSADLTGEPRAQFTRAHNNSLFSMPDGNFSDQVKVDATTTVDLGFDGGELQVKGPAFVYSVGQQGRVSGLGSATWKVPRHTLDLGDGAFCTQGPTTSSGAKLFMGIDPSISQQHKRHHLTIEVPTSQSGLNSLRVQGDTIEFEHLPGFSIQNLNIEENGTEASSKKPSVPGTQRNSTRRSGASKQVPKKDDDDDWGFDVRQ